MVICVQLNYFKLDLIIRSLSLLKFVVDCLTLLPSLSTSLNYSLNNEWFFAFEHGNRKTQKMELLNCEMRKWANEQKGNVLIINFSLWTTTGATKNVIIGHIHVSRLKFCNFHIFISKIFSLACVFKCGECVVVRAKETLRKVARNY